MSFTSEFQKNVFMEMPIGAALHRIICDDEGNAIDYVTTAVNPMFITLIEIKEENVIGIRASEHLSPEELAHWLRVFAPVALEGKIMTYTMYSPRNKLAFNGTAICPEKGYFFVMFDKIHN